MTDLFDPVAELLKDTILKASEQLAQRASADYASRYLHGVRGEIMLREARKEFASEGGIFQDRVRDLRSNSSGLALELPFACGVLMGARFPGAAAAVGVCYERLCPDADPLAALPQD